MKSALGPNVPHADLFVTAGHALLIDGVLVTAGYLINGTTIARYAADEHDELEFFQIKLETHDAIFAEGAPCETLLRVDENAVDSAARVEAAALGRAHNSLSESKAHLGTPSADARQWTLSEHADRYSIHGVNPGLLVGSFEFVPRARSGHQIIRAGGNHASFWT